MGALGGGTCTRASLAQPLPALGLGGLQMRLVFLPQPPLGQFMVLGGAQCLSLIMAAPRRLLQVA